MTTKTKVSFVEAAGIYFGYPECCIKALLQDMRNSTPPRYSRKYFIDSNISGFIPCEYHMKQVIDGEITIQSLIQDRICKHEFPRDGGHVEVIKNVEQLIDERGW